METKPVKLKVPNIVDLYNDKELTIKNTELAILLNSEPKKEWIANHPNIKSRYIPIGIVEYLLTRIFGKWRVEIKESKILANSVLVTVRLYFIDPITGDWDWQDGIGASPLQTDSGAGAIEFDKIKNGAVMMAAPAAESYAIKDAAEKLGKLFGKDLNRKDVMGYDSLNKVNEAREDRELTPTHIRWKDAVKSLRDGNTTLDEIKMNYTLSPENQIKLIDEAI
jgi:hypothetical protein